jgi:hypothetical protein
MKITNILKMNKLQNQLYIVLALVFALLLGACTSDKISAPPTIQIFVNDDDVTAASTVHVTANTRIEYRFEVAAIATIVDLKTVFFDIAIPSKKITKEVLVAGQANSLKETVKGVIFASTDTEIMLVVKDIDGNEVAKSFTFIVD